MASSTDVTRLLVDLRGGNDQAADAIFPIVYDELRRIAHRLLSDEGSHTLSTTGLVHEAYIRIADGSKLSWNDQAHFRAIAARAMRHILIDHARRRTAAKRGGPRRPLSLNESVIAMNEQASVLLALDEALNRLGRLNERLARVVESRFFGGLTEQEIAAVEGISIRTVRRDWTKARAWLYDELHQEGSV